MHRIHLYRYLTSLLISIALCLGLYYSIRSKGVSDSFSAAVAFGTFACIAVLVTISAWVDTKIFVRSVDMERVVADNGRALIMLKEARRDAEIANQSKSAFMAYLCHELRTPLFAITSTLECMDTRAGGLPLSASVSSAASAKASDVKTNVDWEGGFDIIQSSTGVMVTLLNDVLDMSKIEAGKLKFEPIPFDLHAMLHDLIHTFQASLLRLSNTVVISCEILPSVPGYVIGDSHRIRQILANLLSNAIKFTLKGRILLRVGMKAATKGTGTFLPRPIVDVSFDVIDSGMGMDEKTLTNLFDPFTQAKASATQIYGGTGLGLSIVRSLVDMLGGSIHVSSKVAIGSTFSVSLPLAAANRDECSPKTRGQPSPTVLFHTPTPCLVVSPGSTPVLGTSSLLARDPIASTVPPTPGWLLPPGSTPVVGASSNFRGDDSPLLHAPTRKLSRMFAMTPPLSDPNQLLPGVRSLPSTPREPALKPAADLTVTVSSFRATAAPVTVALSHPAAVTTPTTTPISAPHRRVLVVDDNHVNRRIMTRMLTLDGFHVSIACNGLEAVEQVLSGSSDARFDVVLMDLMMPLLDGFEATLRLRAAGAQLPIVAVTANVMNDDRNKCITAGMNAFLAKPFTHQELTRAVQQVLKG